jgi:hypothetical protein
MLRALLIPLAGALTAGGVLLARVHKPAGTVALSLGLLGFSLATLLVLLEH